MQGPRQAAQGDSFQLKQRMRWTCPASACCWEQGAGPPIALAQAAPPTSRSTSGRLFWMASWMAVAPSVGEASSTPELRGSLRRQGEHNTTGVMQQDAAMQGRARDLTAGPRAGRRVQQRLAGTTSQAVQDRTASLGGAAHADSISWVGTLHPGGRSASLCCSLVCAASRHRLCQQLDQGGGVALPQGGDKGGPAHGAKADVSSQAAACLDPQWRLGIHAPTLFVKQADVI